MRFCRFFEAIFVAIALLFCSPAAAQMILGSISENREAELSNFRIKVSKFDFSIEHCKDYVANNTEVFKVEIYSKIDNLIISAAMSYGANWGNLGEPRSGALGGPLGRHFHYVEWLLRDRNTNGSADLTVYICASPSSISVSNGLAAFDLVILRTEIISDAEADKIENIYYSQEEYSYRKKYKVVGSESVYSSDLYYRLFSRISEDVFPLDNTLRFRFDYPIRSDIAPESVSISSRAFVDADFIRVQKIDIKKYQLEIERNSLLKLLSASRVYASTLEKRSASIEDARRRIEEENHRLRDQVSRLSQQVPQPSSVNQDQSRTPNVVFVEKQYNPRCGSQGFRDYDVYVSNLSMFPVQVVIGEVTAGVGGFRPNVVRFNERTREITFRLGSGERERFVGCRGFTSTNGAQEETTYSIISSSPM